MLKATTNFASNIFSSFAILAQDANTSVTNFNNKVQNSQITLIPKPIKRLGNALIDTSIDVLHESTKRDRNISRYKK